MKFWLAFPLFALAQASCYDYEYYDPVTQASIPGNACAQQAAAAGGVVAQPFGQPIGATSFATTTTTQFGQPAVVGSTASLPTYTTATQFAASAPLPTYTSAPLPAYTSAPLPTYTSAPVVAQTSYPAVYSSAPLAPSYAAVAQPSVYASTATRLPISTTSYVAPAVTTTVAAPVAVAAAPVATTAVRASPVVTQTVAQSSQAAELEYYRALGERQARQHRENSRIVREASEDLNKASLVNRIVAGAGNAAPWYPIVRLSNQKEVADAYRSEKKIASKNAEDAYQRYLNDPSRLNLLVSKYQDLNADLRAAAHQYNVINAGTFGQNIAANALGFGSQLTITRLLTSRQQSDDLEDIQRQMRRLARQISDEAQSRVAAAQGGSSQGSVQQRLLGMSQYGPQTQVVRG